MKATRQGLDVSFLSALAHFENNKQQQSPNGIREGEFLALDSFGCHTTPSQPSVSLMTSAGAVSNGVMIAEGGHGTP